MILEVSERTQVCLQGIFGLKGRLPGGLQRGNERLLVGDELPRNGDALRE